MRTPKFLPVTFVVLLVAMSGRQGNAQQAIAAQSGMVHYIEGSVSVGGQLVEHKFGQFPALRNNEELRTEDGKAEVLLTPGAFLRVAEHSSVRMLSTALSDTRVEVLTGSVMVECDELLPDNSLTLVYHGDNIRLEKHGLYRLDTEPAQFRVYDGKAVVQSGSGQLSLKASKETSLAGVPQAEHFNRELADDFLLWSRERSGYLAYASVSAAQSLRGSSASWTSGGWGWSPLLDEFTFLPGRGMIYSPFGYQFCSPFMAGLYDYIPPYYYGSGAWGGYPISPVVNRGTTFTGQTPTQGRNGFIGIGGRAPVRTGDSSASLGRTVPGGIFGRSAAASRGAGSFGGYTGGGGFGGAASGGGGFGGGARAASAGGGGFGGGARGGSSAGGGGFGGGARGGSSGGGFGGGGGARGGVSR